MPISFQADSVVAKKPSSIPSCKALGGTPQHFENLLEQAFLSLPWPWWITQTTSPMTTQAFVTEAEARPGSWFSLVPHLDGISWMGALIYWLGNSSWCHKGVAMCVSDKEFWKKFFSLISQWINSFYKCVKCFPGKKIEHIQPVWADAKSPAHILLETIY